MHGRRVLSVRALLAILSIAGALTPLWAGGATPVLTEDNANLSESAAVASTEPQIAVTNDGTVHVVWQEDSAEGQLILHRFRSPNGVWSPTAEIFYGGTQPSVATDGSSVAVAFVAMPFDHTDTTEILFNVWNPTEQRWGDVAKALDGDIGIAGSQPAIAFDRFDGYLWFLWTSSRRTENAPYYARVLAANGQVESADVIERYEEGAQGPAIVVDTENNAYAAWSTTYASGEAEILLWKWPVGGTHWIRQESPGYFEHRQARALSMATESGVLCLTWHEGSVERLNEVVLECEKPSGVLWLGNLSRSPGERSLVPSIAVDESRGAMVVWRERHNPPPEDILFSQGLPPPLPTPGRVTLGTPSSVDAPALAFHQGYVYAVWVEANVPPGSDIHFARWEAPLPTPTATTLPSPSATTVATTLTPTAVTPTATRDVRTPTATGTVAPPGRIHLPLSMRN